MAPSSVDPDTEQKVWKAVSANPDSSAAILAKKLDGVTPREMVDALNGLLAKSLVKAYKSSDGGLLWKAVNKADAKVKNAMAADERMVYSAIEASGNQGVWSRSIQSSTNLPQAVVTKLLTKLQNSKQIKMVKSVKNPTRKMYMLSHIEPSVELTGGPWYTDFELDVEFIKTIRNACLKYIQTQSFPDPDDTSPTAALYTSGSSKLYPTTTDVAKWLRKSRITETELAPTHVQEILDLLVYDGEVEKLPAFSSSPSGDTDKAGDSDGDNKDGKKKKKSSQKGKEKASSAGKKRKRKAAGSSSDHDEESDSSTAAARFKKEKRRKKVEAEDQSSDEGESKRSKSKKRNRSKARSDSESGNEFSDDESQKRRKKPSTPKKSKKSSKYKGALSGDETIASSESESSNSSSDSSSEEETRSKHRSKSSSKSTKSKAQKKKAKDNDDDSEPSDVDFDLAFGHIFGGDSVYRAIRQERVVGLGWSQQAPCGKCPQADFCEDDGPVNPKGCKYYTDWLLQAVEEW